MNREDVLGVSRNCMRVQWTSKHGKVLSGYISSISKNDVSVWREGRVEPDYIAFADLSIAPDVVDKVVNTGYQPNEIEAILFKVLWYNGEYKFPAFVLDSIAKKKYGLDSLVDTHKIIKKFVRLGFVNKSQHDMDMRRNRYQLSKAGETIAHRVVYPEQYIRSDTE